MSVNERGIWMHGLLASFWGKSLLVATCGCLLGLGTFGCGHAAEPEEEPEAEVQAHPSEVTLGEAAIANAGIRTEPAHRVLLGGGFAVPAEVQNDPAFTAHVAALTASRFVRVDVAVGDAVARGQRLATVASRDVGESRSALNVARIRRDAAITTRDRQAQLVESGIGARRALLDAEAELAAAEAEMRGLASSLRVTGAGAGAETTITSPIDGIVVERHAVPGEVADALATLFVITDPTHLRIVAQVPELDLALARRGAPATLTLSAYPTEQWLGHVDFVAPALDESTRTLEVRATLDAPTELLRSGLFGRLAIAQEGAEPVTLVIPQGALTRIDGDDAVFIPADEPNTFRPVLVRLGRRDGGFVEILEGLSEGQMVVVHGAFTLKSELSRSELAAEE